MTPPAAHYRITAESGSSFRYSFLFLPAAKRDAITAVYAFCRVIDDVVDQERPGREKLEGLGHWRGEIAACYEGRNPREEVSRALLPAIAGFSLPREHFEAVIEGCRMDVEKSRYATFEELKRYCYHVAGAVGLLCVEIFGYRSPQTRDYAVALGTALQLTNILRDVGSDLSRDRIYLPQDELSRFHVTEEMLAQGRLNPAILELLRFQSGRARSYYEKAAGLLAPQDRPNLVAAEIMGSVYAALLGRIEKNGFDVFSKKIQVPRLAQMALALRAYWRAKTAA